MIALPVSFLPFDPHRDSKDSDDESCSESDEELSEDTVNDSINNGDNNHDKKQNRHIGGGVILVRILSFILRESSPKQSLRLCVIYFIFCSNRVRQVNVFLLQC
jgi:hypothetical protein